MRDISFYVGATPVGGGRSFDGGGGSFILKFGMCTVYCVRTNDKLLCARYFFVDNLLACAVVEIILERRSEFVLTRESHKSVFCSE